MSYSPLTELGKKFITHVCVDLFNLGGGNTLLSGKKKYPFPFSGPPLINKVWTCNIMYNGKQVTTGTELSNALIYWFEKYANLYQLDANVIAAQAYIESQYVMWAYPPNSDASGVSQFTMLTTFGVIVRNDYSPEPMSQTDIDTITAGLTQSKYRDSYNTKLPPSAPNIQTTAYVNRPILHQNVINNPEIMIKAQCRYMKYFANGCNSLTSTSLFCYSRGTLFFSNTYSKAIQKCQNAHKNDSNTDYVDEGVNYVLKIFGVLGDKNNIIPIKDYKPKNTGGNFYYFGYDDTQGKDSPKNLKLNQTEFNAYAANVTESDEFGVQKDFGGDIVIETLSNTSDKYKFIYFSEAFYVREDTPKYQIVLHHTASGGGASGGATNDILWWEQQVKDTGDIVSVSFIVTRDGTILQLFSTKYWAYHLGTSTALLIEYGAAGQNKKLNSESIGIEIDSWGGLVNANGKWYPPVRNSTTVANTNAEPIPIANVVEYNAPHYPKGYHGFYGFEKYTDDQITSLRILINAIRKGFPEIRAEYVNTLYPGTDMWGKNVVPGVWTAERAAYAQNKGIWTHVSFVPGKSDCQPQAELVNLLKTLK